MATTLCIDWGNTNIKAAIFEDSTLKKLSNIRDDKALEDVSHLLEAYKPERGILCSVVKHADEINVLLKEKVSKFIAVDGHTATPINNAYASPETLGADRLALVVAAHHIYPGTNNLVICLGTCTTYNLVQKSRTFRGGAISPGLKMRLRAMHEFTDKLPEVAVDGDVMFLGYDTETCMQAGAVYGMAAEIDSMIMAYEAAYPEFNAILTGGDAAFFADKLKSKIFADPDLLLKGLNIISNHNASMYG